MKPSLRKQTVLSKVTCIPSTERPAPNNRGEEKSEIQLITDDVNQVITPEGSLFSSTPGGKMWTVFK